MLKHCDVFYINALLFVSGVRRCKKNLGEIHNWAQTRYLKFVVFLSCFPNSELRKKIRLFSFDEGIRK